MTAGAVITAALEQFDVTHEQLLDHSQRGPDVMDARAMIVWVLQHRLDYSDARAAKAVGYTPHKWLMGRACKRLHERVARIPRLRRQIDRRWPEAVSA